MRIIKNVAISDWISYTPSFTNLGTVTNISFFYRRLGDSIQIRGSATVGTTAAAAPASFSLPSGLSIDTAKIPGSNLATLGYMIGNVTTAGSAYPGTSRGTWNVTYNSSAGATVLIMTDTVDADAGIYESARNANTFLSNSSKFTVETGLIPIAGWTSYE